MNADQKLIIKMVDEVGIYLDRIQTLADAIVSGHEGGLDRDNVIVLADMIGDLANDADAVLVGWYDSRRAYSEPASAPEHPVCKPCADRFDHQNERPGTLDLDH